MTKDAITIRELHINRPSSTRFVAQVRARGCRTWTECGPMRQSKAAAIKDMAREFAKGGWKRGRVLLTADYYDPTVVVEMNQ